MKILYSLILVILSSGFSIAQEVTYAEDIAKIIYKNCSVCHRPGEIGPMSLTNFDEVKQWGQTIKFVTESKFMPPWQPDPSYSRFLEENFLTEEEITKIANWVDNDMPRGDISLEPAFPNFPDGSVLGEPDLVLEMEQEWLHKGNNQDDYRYFVLPTDLPEDKIIKAVEFRPGNSSIVHHALVFEDTTGEAAQNDAATPEYGFDGFGSFLGGDQTNILNQKQYPGFVPGQKPVFFPDGIGQKLHAGADIVVQMHYAPWPVDETDQSKINIFFADEEEEIIDREVQGHIMVPLQEVIGELFFIPANTIKEFHGTWTIPQDISFISTSPHMHLLGKHWEVWMEKPNGERVDLIRINDWDFNWQGSYSFDRFIVAPAGTVVHAVASYDNTVNNPNNPSFPPQFTTWGEGTTDEMYYLPFSFVPYKDGDEDIVFSTSTNEPFQFQNHLISITPNPTTNLGIINFEMIDGMPLSIEIFNIQGKRVRTLRNGEFYNIGKHSVNFAANQLEAGVYFVQIRGENLLMTEKFIKQ